MHSKFGGILKLGATALILAFATGASAYQQIKKTAVAESRLSAVESAPLPGKSRGNTAQAKEADSYVALHLDMAGTPFLGQIAATATVAADAACSTKLRKKDRQTW